MGRRGADVILMLSLVGVAPVLGGCRMLLGSFGGDAVLESAAPASAAPASAAPATAPPSPDNVASSPPAGSPGAVPTAEQVAALLGPDDFTAVGVTGAGAPSTNGDTGEVYVVYAGLSAGAGGIELDVFVLDSAEDAATLVADPGLFALDATSKQDIGADRATIIEGSATNDGTSTFDTLWAQKGRLAFALGIPTATTSRDQLLALAKLVLERSADYQ